MSLSITSGLSIAFKHLTLPAHQKLGEVPFNLETAVGS